MGAYGGAGRPPTTWPPSRIFCFAESAPSLQLAVQPADEPPLCSPGAGGAMGRPALASRLEPMTCWEVARVQGAGVSASTLRYGVQYTKSSAGERG